ncbi:rhomboid-domain-containing protein [Lentithecium fluviatile CBS 122367]|uniref:Rhomboid-type serine protease n=1 Tax=Lentithecium fluviatile CBS 122367 TaxID=1168545 RepID=A0A6G1J8Z5_9PLEO|nr:rhomboid-domain-containing protein [Lentithecium fluviatile CBS 122367]
MAANDYYNPQYSASGALPAPHAHSPTHTDSPLPPVPGSNTTYSSQQQGGVSPVTSPFDDSHRYDYPSTTHLTHADTTSSSAYGDTAYHGGADTPLSYNSRYDPPANHQSDPFGDHSAIPLQNQGKMGEGAASAAVYGADPERRYTGEKRRKKKGWFSGRVTWVVYFLTTVQIGVFVGEIIKNGVLTGSPIQTKPNFNIMIGPSPYVLINMGARFQPCMHYVQKVLDNGITSWPCPNTTTTDAFCTLSQLCGMGGVPEQDPTLTWENRTTKPDLEPDQWWRFITPIFLHAGIIHIGFNMLLQMTLGRDMEKEIGSLRFTLVYFSAGIFGFVLGGNYAAEGITSVGASGSLFGILALVLLDLLYNWQSRRSPMKDLLFLLLDVAIAFVLGLLPGLDNFAHIGGFLMGLVLGVCLLHSPQALRERIGVDEPPYSTVETAPNAGIAPGLQKFVKQPVGFFKGRKPFWWAWWVVRVGGLVAVFIGFILLLRNFYEWRNGCSWCHHLTCLPITTNGVNWCDMGALNPTTTTQAAAGPTATGT